MDCGNSAVAAALRARSLEWGAAGTDSGMKDEYDNALVEPGKSDVADDTGAESRIENVTGNAGTEPGKGDVTGAAGTRCGFKFSDNGCNGSIGLGGRGDGCGRSSNEGGDNNGVLDSRGADVDGGESSGNNWSYGGGTRSVACSGGDIDRGSSASGCGGWSNCVDIGSVSDCDEIGGNQLFSDHTQPGCPQCHSQFGPCGQCGKCQWQSGQSQPDQWQPGWTRKRTLWASTKTCMSG